HFGSVKDKVVALWGLTFKPGTDDVRESPAMAVAERLLAWGAKVVGHDPQGEANFKRSFGERKGMTYAESAYGALKGADALVLVTEWSEYKRPNWQKLAST